MIVLFFLCVKLSILHLCVSDLGYQCNKKPEGDLRKAEIFLVDDNNNDYQKKLNGAFQTLCQNYYDITTGFLNKSDGFENIIHLAVPDYYDGKPLNDFVYAGNITKNGNPTCTKTDGKPGYDCHEFANLVSTSAYKINDGHLFNFVQAMEYKDDIIFNLPTAVSCEPSRNTSDLTVVLLCLPQQYLVKKEVNLKNLILIQKLDVLCQHDLSMEVDIFNDTPEIPWDFIGFRNPNFEFKHRLLAVLAPEPYKTVSDVSVPTIFYKTPYMYSEDKADFPNSMNLAPWRLLKYGFLKFIQSVGWHRVAIVSDDSEYSAAFEDELTALFREEKDIVHTVMRCEDGNCDMRTIAQDLFKASARIVIANVEEKNARILFQIHGIVWLLRDMTEKTKFLDKDQDAFSLSLHINTKTNEGCDVEDNILAGLSGIAQAYENTNKLANKLSKSKFYSHFADVLKRVTPKITEAEIFIHKISQNKPEEISRMSVNENGVTKISNKVNPFPGGKPTDGTAHCLLTTYDYFRPCEDPLVLLFMFALMMFILTILLISCYFDKTSPYNDIRYQNF